MLRKTAWGSLLVVLGLVSLLTVRYQLWVAEAGRQIENRSSVIETAAGPIEFDRTKGEGPVVLLIHGTPGGYDQLAGLGKLTSDAGFEWLTPSRPGYLRTPLAVGRTPAQQADAYVALLDALEIESVAVVGGSGGGPSAIQFAIRHPDRCWALVALSGVSRAPRPEEIHPEDDPSDSAMAFLGTNLGGWLLTGLLVRRPEAMLEQLVGDESNRRRILEHPERRDAFVAIMSSALLLPERRNEGMRNDMEQFQAMKIPQLEAIRAPTLVLHGTADRTVPLAMGELVAERVPGARLVTFENADHFMVASHPREVFGAMFDFLREQQP